MNDTTHPHVTARAAAEHRQSSWRAPLVRASYAPRRPLRAARRPWAAGPPCIRAPPGTGGPCRRARRTCRSAEHGAWRATRLLVAPGVRSACSPASGTAHACWWLGPGWRRRRPALRARSGAVQGGGAARRRACGMRHSGSGGRRARGTTPGRSARRPAGTWTSGADASCSGGGRGLKSQNPPNWAPRQIAEDCAPPSRSCSAGGCSCLGCLVQRPRRRSCSSNSSTTAATARFSRRLGRAPRGSRRRMPLAMRPGTKNGSRMVRLRPADGS